MVVIVRYFSEFGSFRGAQRKSDWRYIYLNFVQQKCSPKHLVFSDTGISITMIWCREPLHHRSYGLTPSITHQWHHYTHLILWSDSGRLLGLYFSRIIFFRPPIFRRPPWADFFEILPHDAVCPETVYLLYLPPNKFERQIPQFLPIFGPKIDTLTPPPFPNVGKTGNLKQ